MGSGIVQRLAVSVKAVSAWRVSFSRKRFRLSHDYPGTSL
jgi:hypothetical protein